MIMKNVSVFVHRNQEHVSMVCNGMNESVTAFVSKMRFVWISSFGIRTSANASVMPRWSAHNVKSIKPLISSNVSALTIQFHHVNVDSSTIQHFVTVSVRRLKFVLVEMSLILIIVIVSVQKLMNVLVEWNLILNCVNVFLCLVFHQNLAQSSQQLRFTHHSQCPQVQFPKLSTALKFSDY